MCLLICLLAPLGSEVVDFSGPSNEVISYADTSNVIIAHVEVRTLQQFTHGSRLHCRGASRLFSQNPGTVQRRFCGSSRSSWAVCHQCDPRT